MLAEIYVQKIFKKIRIISSTLLFIIVAVTWKRISIVKPPKTFFKKPFHP
jgi:hypothetical protein